MTDLDVKMTEDIPLTNPSDEQSKAQINDVLNRRDREPEPEDEEIIAPEEDDTAAPPPLVVKEIMPDEEVFKDVPPPSKRPKKKVSEKQLEHLAKAREKAAANRKAKAEAKRLEKEAKNDIKIKHTKKVDFVTSSDVAEVIKKEYPTFQQFTQADILRLQEDAINNYDTKRKKRKEEKKQKQLKEHVEKKNYEAVTRAVHHPLNPDPDDVWGLCFN